jgi:hypothetical protein
MRHRTQSMILISAPFYQAQKSKRSRPKAKRPSVIRARSPLVIVPITSILPTAIYPAATCQAHARNDLRYIGTEYGANMGRFLFLERFSRSKANSIAR